MSISIDNMHNQATPPVHCGLISDTGESHLPIPCSAACAVQDPFSMISIHFSRRVSYSKSKGPSACRGDGRSVTSSTAENLGPECILHLHFHVLVCSGL